MIRQAAALILLALLLTGCAQPPFDPNDDSQAGGMVEPVMVPALVAPSPPCGPGDDGIGGTGCQAE